MEYFKQLNINEKSSKDDIKKAYFKLILKHHPDKGGDTQTFIKIKKTYDSLLISKFAFNTISKPSFSQPFKEDNKPFKDDNKPINQPLKEYTGRQILSEVIKPSFQSFSQRIKPSFQSFSQRIKPSFQSYSQSIRSCFQPVLTNYTPTFNKFKNYNLRSIFLGSVIGYITLRHILPKKDVIFDIYNSNGDKVFAHTYVNCILFDQVKVWYEDGDETNSYFWRRTKKVNTKKPDLV
jgi:curved DNA-binding protein CbpA